jgi:hypothetical protein
MGLQERFLATMAEAEAMKEGLALANRIGCNVTIEESDSSETIEACQGEEVWWSEPAAIYADCIDLASSIGNVIFKFCLREANKTAHKLAKFGFLSKNSCNWDDEPPNFLLSNIINDLLPPSRCISLARIPRSSF